MATVLNTGYGSGKVTYLILFGSLILDVILSSILIIHDIVYAQEFRTRTIIGLSTIFYLLLCWTLLRAKRIHTVKLLLLILYSFIAFLTLLLWGLNATFAIFATCFVIILSGILFGSRTILPFALITVTLLFLVQTIHSLSILKPDTNNLSVRTTYLDAIAYATILGAFALVTWIFNNQNEKSLKRALEAERTLFKQKQILALELEKESARLRQIQLKEVEQLYKFATLGQNTAATLHELSNHLSILNMDIDDLKQQNKHSEAIKNAQDTVHQINLALRQIKRKLNDYDEEKAFSVAPVIEQVVKDQERKCNQNQVKLIHRQYKVHNVKILGNPLALAQVLTILIDNAIDACLNHPSPRVRIKLIDYKKYINISVTDNGIGIEPNKQPLLFTPTQSSKANGLGVGLYIAKHIIESQLHGAIKYAKPQSSHDSTEFIIQIPKK